MYGCVFTHASGGGVESITFNCSTGTIGKFYEFVTFVRDEPDQYGNNGFITEAVTLEEKNTGKKGTVLGNKYSASFLSPNLNALL